MSCKEEHPLQARGFSEGSLKGGGTNHDPSTTFTIQLHAYVFLTQNFINKSSIFYKSGSFINPSQARVMQVL